MVTPWPDLASFFHSLYIKISAFFCLQQQLFPLLFSWLLRVFFNLSLRPTNRFSVFVWLFLSNVTLAQTNEVTAQKQKFLESTDNLLTVALSSTTLFQWSRFTRCAELLSTLGFVYFKHESKYLFSYVYRKINVAQELWFHLLSNSLYALYCNQHCIHLQRL